MSALLNPFEFYAACCSWNGMTATRRRIGGDCVDPLFTEFRDFRENTDFRVC